MMNDTQRQTIKKERIRNNNGDNGMMNDTQTNTKKEQEIMMTVMGMIVIHIYARITIMKERKRNNDDNNNNDDTQATPRQNDNQEIMMTIIKK